VVDESPSRTSSDLPRRGRLNGVFKRLAVLIPYAVGIAAMVGIILYLRRTDLLRNLDLREVRWGYVGIVLITEAMVYLLRGLILRLFAAMDRVYLTVYEAFALSIINTMSNILIPFSGALIARAGYMKARHGLPVTRFWVFATVTTLLVVFVSGLVGLIAIVGAALFLNVAVGWIVPLLFAAMVVAPVAAILLPVDRLRLSAEGRVMRLLHSVREGWLTIRADRALLAKQIILTTLIQMMQSLSIYFGLQALGVGIPFYQSVLVSELTSLVNFVRITPGGLGVAESVYAVSAELVGSTAAQGLAAGLLIRLVDWSFTFTLGPIFMIILTRRAQETLSTQAATSNVRESAS